MCTWQGLLSLHLLLWHRGGTWQNLLSLLLFAVLIRPFLSALKKLCLTTKCWALGFQKDGWFSELAHTSQTWWWIAGVLFRMCPSPQWVQVCRLCVEQLLMLCKSLNRLVMIWRAWLSFLALLSPPPPTPKLKVHFLRVLIRGEWRKVPDGYLRDASSQLEHDERFINELAKRLVAELRAIVSLTPVLGAKPKSSDTKADLIYKHAFCNYL